MKKKIAVLLGAVMVVVNCGAGFLNTSSTGVLAGEGYGAATVMSAEAETNYLEGLLDMSELCGWATVPAEGLVDGVTGGGNRQPVVVTTMEEFEAVAGDNIPRVIVIDGRIECTSYGATVGSNKTIIGADKDATIYGGFRIHNQSNVIISNLNIEGTWPNSGPDDCLEIKNSHHLWFNHLNIWNSTDGNVDITLGSDYVTVSWCKLWYTEDAKDGVEPEQTHRLSCLVGSGTGHDDTDLESLKVTYHHNWFADRLDQRMPRVMYGRVHVYNNYYTCTGNTYCIGADCYASVLIENNYFKNVKNPHQFSYDPGFPASITARGNSYDNTSGTKTTGQHHTDSEVVPFETTVYDYYLNDAEDIPALIEKYAGPQDMTDSSVVAGEMNNTTDIKGKEDTATPSPEVSALPTQKPVNVLNDNPITYDKNSATYTYHGQNSDDSNAYYTIENPFAGKDFSETPAFSGGYPVWTKGVTISYWVKVPTGAVDAALLNFNLENDRQINRNDEVKYRLCQNYSASDSSYKLGTETTYVDASGREYKVLKGYGTNVRYNPNYPTTGCYSETDGGGAIYAYEKGKDSAVASNWTYLNYIGSGLYENYGVRFDEKGGSSSKLNEGLISGSFSLYASGSMGYRQDNWKSLQMNPYLSNYGQTFDAQQYNQFYYWGNGGYHTLSGGTLTPTMKEKDQWHFIAVVIKNDWVQFYMDGTEMNTDYLEWWGKAINVNTGSQGFNLGYGQAKNYRTKSPADSDTTGMTLLDFISDKDTVLTVGGMGAGAANLSQDGAGTPDGTQIKDIQFYNAPIDAAYILEDGIDTKNMPVIPDVPDRDEETVTSPEPSATPIPEPSSQPSANPNQIPFSGKLYIASDSLADGLDFEGYTGDVVGWGDVIASQYTSNVTIINEAKYGDSTKSYYYDYDNDGDGDGHRYKAVYDNIAENDYVIICFGHNDGPANRDDVPVGKDTATTKASDIEGTFQWYLKYKFINPALDAGALPILMTPVVRCMYNSTTGAFEEKEYHLAYAQAMRDLVAEYAANGIMIPLIDAQQYTYDTYSKLSQSEAARWHATGDITHYNRTGAEWISAYIAGALLNYNLEINTYLADTSATPAPNPTHAPIITSIPSVAPSNTPGSTPSAIPSVAPSNTPGVTPSSIPSVAPSGTPSAIPSIQPTSSVEPEHYMPGDVDNNGKIELADAQLALKAALKIITLEELPARAADVDMNGSIQLQDAQLILKKALKIIEKFDSEG